jgi:hypothetical protein
MVIAGPLTDVSGGGAVADATPDGAAPDGATPVGKSLGPPDPLSTRETDAQPAQVITAASAAAAETINRFMPVGRGRQAPGCVRLVTEVLRPEPRRVGRTRIGLTVLLAQRERRVTDVGERSVVR